MTGGTVRGSRPRGCLRALLRAPIWLYRLRLGWLLGRRFLLIVHRGRRTGKRRETVVEVVRYDRRTGTYVVASGWGTRADWYRNVRVTPEVTVASGGRRFAARAVPLPAGVAARELVDYARRHPRAFAALARLMVGETPPEAGGVPAEMVARVPLLAFVRV